MGDRERLWRDRWGGRERAQHEQPKQPNQPKQQTLCYRLGDRVGTERAYTVTASIAENAPNTSNRCNREGIRAGDR